MQSLGMFPLTLVFVEPRLLDSISVQSSPQQDLKSRLINYKQDLTAEGRTSLVLAASVYAQKRQSGRSNRT